VLSFPSLAYAQRRGKKRLQAVREAQALGSAHLDRHHRDGQWMVHLLSRDPQRALELTELALSIANGQGMSPDRAHSVESSGNAAGRWRTRQGNANLGSGLRLRGGKPP